GAGAGLLRAPLRGDARALRRPRLGRAQARSSLFGAVGGGHVRPVFPRLGAVELRGSDAMRRRGVHAFLPRHARARGVSRALGLRGRLRVLGALGRGHRGHHRGSRSRVQRIAPYTRKSVASPRKMKNPPLSVIAVISTEEPSAGSRPRRSIVSGISTPAVAASVRLRVIAAVITSPSDTLLYSQ